MSRQSGRGPLPPWFHARLQQQIAHGLFLPPDDLRAVGRSLAAHLVDYREQASVSTAVLDMSGGVDSAVTAALLKSAGWRVVGYTLPIEQAPEETERGIEAYNALGLEHLLLDLSAQYRDVAAGLSALDGDLRPHRLFPRGRRCDGRGRAGPRQGDGSGHRDHRRCRT